MLLDHDMYIHGRARHGATRPPRSVYHSPLRPRAVGGSCYQAPTRAAVVRPPYYQSLFQLSMAAIVLFYGPPLFRDVVLFICLIGIRKGPFSLSIYLKLDC